MLRGKSNSRNNNNKLLILKLQICTPLLHHNKAKIAEIMKHNAKRDINFICACGWINLLVRPSVLPHTSRPHHVRFKIRCREDRTWLYTYRTYSSRVNSNEVIERAVVKAVIKWLDNPQNWVNCLGELRYRYDDTIGVVIEQLTAVGRGFGQIFLWPTFLYPTDTCSVSGWLSMWILYL